MGIASKKSSKNKLISFSRLKTLNEIGKGEFGKVLLCQLDNSKLVAVKTLTTNSETVTSDFLKEVEIISKINGLVKSPYVIKLIGISEQPLAMITEYKENGDLHTFLKMRNSEIPELEKTLWKISSQICSGMESLTSLNIVHRDLAARNVLIDKDFNISIGDFGMSRDTFSNSYYKISGRAILPIRWM